MVICGAIYSSSAREQGKIISFPVGIICAEVSLVSIVIEKSKIRVLIAVLLNTTFPSLLVIQDYFGIGYIAPTRQVNVACLQWFR